MPLPAVPLPTGELDIAGTKVPIRALSRLEVVRLTEMENVEAEPYALSCAAGIPLDEATAWLGSVDARIGNQVAMAILELSAVKDPRVGSTGAGPDAGPSNEP